jgi:hypothetical protein
MPDKKQIRSAAIPFAIGIVLALAVLFIMAASAGYDVLVKDSSGFYRAHSLFIAGNVFICSRDTAGFATRKEALENAGPGAGLSFISMKQVELIELVAGREGGPALGEWNATLKDYIGDYQMNAAGNRGFLSLRASGSYIYGTLRFPDWGRGATEYLKNVRIVRGKIYFTRSVTTPQELKRVGGNAYFVQQYSGEYLQSGQMIRGFYTVYGARKTWEAVKNR